MSTSLASQVRKIDRNPQEPGETIQKINIHRNRTLYGTVLVHNDAKGDILSTVSYSDAGVAKAESARLSPGGLKQFLIPHTARDTVVVKIEKFEFCPPDTSLWPPELTPYRQVLLMDITDKPKPEFHKCYVARGPENNMKAAHMPCFDHRKFDWS